MASASHNVAEDQCPRPDGVERMLRIMIGGVYASLFWVLIAASCFMAKGFMQMVSM